MTVNVFKDKRFWKDFNRFVWVSMATPHSITQYFIVLLTYSTSKSLYRKFLSVFLRSKLSKVSQQSSINHAWWKTTMEVAVCYRGASYQQFNHFPCLLFAVNCVCVVAIETTTKTEMKNAWNFPLSVEELSTMHRKAAWTSTQAARQLGMEQLRL